MGVTNRNKRVTTNKTLLLPIMNLLIIAIIKVSTQVFQFRTRMSPINENIKIIRKCNPMRLTGFTYSSEYGFPIAFGDLAFPINPVSAIIETA